MFVVAEPGRMVRRDGDTVTVATFSAGVLHCGWGPAVARFSPGEAPGWEQWISGERDVSGVGAACWWRDERVAVEFGVDPVSGWWVGSWFDRSDGEALPVLTVTAAEIVVVAGDLPELWV